MNKAEVKKLDNTQLLFYFLVTRDNLISCKIALEKNSQEEKLRYIYNEEEKNYTALLNEIYRRMK